MKCLNCGEEYTRQVGSMTLIFDACALVALLQNEEGADKVAASINAA